MTSYPVGHPKVHVMKRSEQIVNWNKSPYKGILKVLVLPPKELDVPVLPVKFDG
jgi:hypothetical protein